MAAPTQEYPPWLTPVPTVVTDSAGTLTTSTSVEYLPLTYYGPSIPLDTLWTYGGSVSPTGSVTIPTSITISATTATTTPLTVTSAIPTTSITNTSPAITFFSPSPSSAATASSTATAASSTATAATTTSSITNTSPAISFFSPSPSSSSAATASSIATAASSTATAITTTSSLSFFTPTSTSSASVSSPSTTSSTSSSSILPTPSVTPAGHLSRGQLIGIIVAGILSLIFIFACLIFFWLCYKQRSNRNSRTRFSYITPIDEDYFVVGEGSPRHSGEEADPFLRRGGSPVAGPSGTQQMTQVGPELGMQPPPRIPLPPTGSLSSNGSSSTGASGYGVLLDRPSLGLLPSTPEEGAREQGEPLSPHDIQRMQDESVLPPDDQYPDEEYTGAYAYSSSPLLPPPRLVDPERAFHPMEPPRPPFKNIPSHLSHQSSYDGEEAVTLTARRVKVEPQYSPVAGPSSSSGGLLDALRLSGLGRLSWFNKDPSEPRLSTHSQDYTIEPFTDAEIEHGRLRNPNVGLGPDGVRPTSNISARSAASGNTVYHDAYSSAPDTPLLAPLPRAVTPAEAPSVSEQGWMSGSPAPPPAYEDPYTDSPTARSPGGNNFSMQPSIGDILDTPIPSALPHFVSSTSSRDTNNTSSSIALRNHPYPPGLALISPKSWANSDFSSTAGSSPRSPVHLVSPNTDPLGGGGVAIDIDILEEEPPNAGEGWRSMASNIFGPAGRRTTFGLPQYVYQPDFTSEQGSLHSMRSHLSPSSRSTGSAPASRRDVGGSFGSNSSRPSAYSAALSLNSLSRQGSIGSDNFGRRRGGPISPSLSALGGHHRAGPGSGSGAGFGLASVGEAPLPAIIGPLPSAHMTPDRSTIRAVASGSPTLKDTERTTSPPLSPSFRMSAPWAAGPDNDWTPA